MIRIFTTAVMAAIIPFGVFASGPFDVFGSPARPIDFGTQVSDREVSSLIQILEDKTWSRNQAILVPIAKQVPLNTRFQLYDKYKIAGAWAFLNLYGIGSFIQGDPWTSVAEIGGIALGETAIVASSQLSSGGTDQKIWMTTGSLLVAGSLVYGLVRPWFFAEEQNKNLRKALFESD